MALNLLQIFWSKKGEQSIHGRAEKWLAKLNTHIWTFQIGKMLSKIQDYTKNDFYPRIWRSRVHVLTNRATSVPGWALLEFVLRCLLNGFKRRFAATRRQLVNGRGRQGPGVESLVRDGAAAACDGTMMQMRTSAGIPRGILIEHRPRIFGTCAPTVSCPRRWWWAGVGCRLDRGRPGVQCGW